MSPPSAIPAFNQEDIQNPALKLPANAHYFCPYCDFLTKTASRFHIHYMQHLNVRPFECSVCRIKSNWLWDINKHIRTRLGKGDASHRGAKCVCINEAGLRDYSKYRCFIKEVSSSGERITFSRNRPNQLLQPDPLTIVRCVLPSSAAGSSQR